MNQTIAAQGLPTNAEITKAVSHIKDATKRKLATHFTLNQAQERELINVIRNMIEDGELALTPSQKLRNTAGQAVEGIVKSHPKGFGFLLLNEQPDWFIPPHVMDTLEDGAKVRAIPLLVEENGTVADIIKVLSLPKQLLGIVEAKADKLTVKTNKGKRYNLDDNETKVATGQWVVFDVVHAQQDDNSVEARLTKVLNGANSANMAFHFGMTENNALVGRTQEVVSASQKVSSEAVASSDRIDVTHIPFCTIDGETAKDLDDAVYCEMTETGYTLIVGIADVTAYIQKDDVVDLDAQLRMTSIYTPCNVAPMLDPSLSNQACSLNPDEDKNAFVCEMKLNHDGKLLEYKFFEGVIRSQKRFSYNRLQSMLDRFKFNSTPEAVVNSVFALSQLYEQLKLRREERNMFNFDRNEHVFHFDAKGVIEDITVYETFDTHKMIEEAMIMTNVCAAKFIKEHELLTLFRNHDKPKQESVDEINEFLKDNKVDVRLPDDFNLAKVKQVVRFIEESDLASGFDALIRKAMPPAFYGKDESYHFGLNLHEYAHFTSPIRRYPDVVTHRIIKHILSTQGVSVVGAAPYENNELDLIGMGCNVEAKRAMLVERKANDYLAVNYIKQHRKETFDAALATEIKSGVFISIMHGLVQGFLPKSEIECPERIMALNAGELKVQVAAIDDQQYKIDFKVVS